jgi:periplasmic divalent cation tolerance protein
MKDEMTGEFIQVTTAIDTRENAHKIAEEVVQKRLAACVHVYGPITSTYWWQGTREVAEEWVCTAKTRKDLFDKLMETIRSLHPYEEPEIIALPISAGSRSYLDWIAQETIPS